MYARVTQRATRVGGFWILGAWGVGRACASRSPKVDTSFHVDATQPPVARRLLESPLPLKFLPRSRVMEEKHPTPAAETQDTGGDGAALEDGTTRRRFVVQTLRGLTGAALLVACGDEVTSNETGPTGSSSASGTGASGG